MDFPDTAFERSYRIRVSNVARLVRRRSETRPAGSILTFSRAKEPDIELLPGRQSVREERNQKDYGLTLDNVSPSPRLEGPRR